MSLLREAMKQVEPQIDNTEYSKDLIAFSEKYGIDPSQVNIINDPNTPDPTPHEISKRGIKLDKRTGKEILRNLQYVQSKLGIDFTLDSVNKDTIVGTIRSKTETEEIDAMKEFASNNPIPCDQIFDMPKLENFQFNRDLESNVYDFIHIAIDTEADQNSQMIAIQIHNFEARRTVLGVIDASFSYKEYIQPDGSTIIYVRSPNLNDCIVFADIETVIASIVLSASSQGHKRVSQIVKMLREKFPFPSFDHVLLKNILFDTHRSLHIYFNAKYDIEQLRYNHRKNKRKLNVLGSIVPEELVLTSFKKRKNQIVEDQYKFRLGNTMVGFRYTITAYGSGKYKSFNVKIAPNQADAYPLSFLTDALRLAFALQKKKYDPQREEESFTLLALSHDLLFKKIHLESEKKVFSIEDFPDPTIELTEAVKYGIWDVYATLNVYADLTQTVQFSGLNKLLGIRIDNTRLPLSSRLSSTAGLSKHILFAYFQSKTGLSRKQIEKNIEIQRLFLKNFERIYLGAKNEVFAQGLIKSTSKQKIFYDDFNSLYPHTGWLIEAELLYLLASKNKLHEYISSDIKEGIDRIQKSVSEFLTCIRSGTPFEKKTFRRLSGNISVRISSGMKLLLPTRMNGKRTETYTSGVKNVGMNDLVIAIVRKHLTDKTPVRKIFQSLNFLRAEYINFKNHPSTAYGEEFFTKIYKDRAEIVKKMKLLEKQGKKETDEYVELNSTQMLLKIIMNASYGISAEGISKSDWTGVLFVPVIADLITQSARGLISLAEIIVDYLGALKIYMDTDSLIYRATKEQSDFLRSMFSKTVGLKDENPKDPIQQFFSAHKKAYGYITKSGKIKNNVAGQGQYNKRLFDKTLKFYYSKLFKVKFSERVFAEISRLAKFEHPPYQDIYLDSKKSSIYIGLSKFFTKKAKVVDEFELDEVTYYVIYQFEKDSYLITSAKDLILGQFGTYLNATPKKQKHKLIFWNTVPVDPAELFDKFLQVYYVEGMDKELKVDPLNLHFRSHQVYRNILDAFDKEIADKKTFDNMIRKRKIPHFQGLEKKIIQMKDILENRNHLEKRLEKYFTFDATALRRKKVGSKETFFITDNLDEVAKDIPFKTLAKNLKTEVETDGMTYFFNIPLANAQFSNELKANLDRYYSYNIKQLSLTASKIYYATHKKTWCASLNDEMVVSHSDQCKSPECPIIQATYTKKSELPTPLKGKSVLIPLRFQLKPQVRNGYIYALENIDPLVVEKLEDKEIINKSGKILKQRSFETWYLKQYEQEWMELQLWDSTWSISIESYNSTNFNATLNVNILPEKNTYFTFRSITGQLHVNPLSFNLVNMNLFKTTLQRCINNTQTITPIFTKLFNDREFHIFTRANAITKEELDLRSTENTKSDKILEEEENDTIIHDDNMNYYRQLFYTWIAKDIILEKYKHINVRLTQLTISKQMTFDRDIKFAMGIYSSKVIQKYRDNKARTPEMRLAEAKELSVYPHKASTGISVTNSKNGFSLSVYAKDHLWIESKVNRISKRRNLTLAQMKKVLNQQTISNVLRYELACFGLENILQLSDETILDQTENMLHKSMKIANRIEDDYKAELDQFYDEIPAFYTDRNYSLNPDFLNFG